MKQLPFLTFLVISVVSISAQDYIPMAVDSATWFMGSTDENPQFNELFVLRLEGDTLVNNLSYSKIYRYEYDNGIELKTRKLLGLLRDEVAGKKVYGGFLDGIQEDFQSFLNYDGQCDWGDSATFSEHLLYDFDVSEGDTITSCMLTSTTEISEINTIERYGFQRRNLSLDDDDETIMTEGIGTCMGIFKGYQCFFTGGGYTYALYNYCIGPFSNCDLVTATVETNNLEHIELSPNPVSDLLYIYSTSDFSSMSLFDLQGKLMETFESAEQIDMSTYHSGMYILRLQSVDGRIFSKRLIKV